MNNKWNDMWVRLTNGRQCQEKLAKVTIKLMRHRKPGRKSVVILTYRSQLPHLHRMTQPEKICYVFNTCWWHTGRVQAACCKARHVLLFEPGDSDDWVVYAVTYSSCSWCIWTPTRWHVISARTPINFGMEEWTEGLCTPPCQISPPSMQRVDPAGRETSKSASE